MYDTRYSQVQSASGGKRPQKGRKAAAGARDRAGAETLRTLAGGAAARGGASNPRASVPTFFRFLGGYLREHKVGEGGMLGLSCG